MQVPAPIHDFFVEFFGGEHHFPKPIEPYGQGWAMPCVHLTKFASWDFDGLTRLVLLAHDRAIRVELAMSMPGHVKVVCHQRTREGKPGLPLMSSHPTIEEVLRNWRKRGYTDTATPQANYPISRHD